MRCSIGTVTIPDRQKPSEPFHDDTSRYLNRIGSFVDTKCLLPCLKTLGSGRSGRQCQTREYWRWKYHCTIDLLFDWFGLVCFANKNKNCWLSYSWFQTSQTGGRQYNDTSPFSIPWTNALAYCDTEFIRPMKETHADWLKDSKELEFILSNEKIFNILFQNKILHKIVCNF